MPGLAVGAAAILMVGIGMVVGLYLLTRLIGTEPRHAPDSPVADTGHPQDSPPKNTNGPPTPPAATQQLAADYLADSFTGVVAAHPKRLLASQTLAALPQREMFQSLAVLGLDPRQAEDLLLYLDPLPGGNMLFSFGGVVRFAAPVGGKDKLLALFPGATEAKYQNQTYYRLNSQLAGAAWAVFLIDDRTAAAAPEPTLKKMLSAKGAKGPLLDRVQKASFGDDLTAIVAVEPMRALAREAAKQIPQGAATTTASVVGEQIDAVSVTANVSRDPMLVMDVETKSELSAQAVLKVVNSGRESLQSQYPKIRTAILNGAPPDVPPLVDQFCGDLNKSFAATANGSHVVISINQPAVTKDLVAKLGPMLRELTTGPAGNPPAPNPPPNLAPEVKDVREVGVQWVRDNNAFGPNDKIVDLASMRLNQQVGGDDGGFVAMFGARLMKSKTPTMLVGWNGEALPLTMTAEQAKLAGLADAVMTTRTLRAADDVGPEAPVGRLSDLKIEHAEALDGAAPLTGTVAFHRLRPDDADQVFSLRMVIPAGNSQITLYQHLRTRLPKEDGTLTLDFPPADARSMGLLNGPTPVLVEVVAYLGAERQGKPLVASNPTAVLVAAAPK
ncbi:MAG TPA: hypothetical protein VMS17_18740 [Gemmataceae bacterium]|nr:hypothetical protein [Gemmataceae bacterium]